MTISLLKKADTPDVDIPPLTASLSRPSLLPVRSGIELNVRDEGNHTMRASAECSGYVRAGFSGMLFCMWISLIGCPKPIPKVAIPSADPSPPTMVWETYNMQSRERGEIVKDGQLLEVPSSDPYVITLAVEDLNSGVKDVTLSGNVQYRCEQGSQVEDKKFQIETQEAKSIPDQEAKVPVRASLVYAVEFARSGCKEKWVFGGGKLSLTGKAHNFIGGAETRTLYVNLKK